MPAADKPSYDEMAALVVVLSEKLTAAEAEIAELPPQLGRNSYRRRFGAPSSKDVATFNRWHSSGTSK